MKFAKVYSAILLVMLICALFLPVAALAHGGRTDANGGHYDRSTGEYHYHHGYPEHQHTDIDGDGVDDCPYDFVDKTNHNGGGSVTVSSPEPTVLPTFYDTKDTEVEDDNGPSPLLVIGLVGTTLGIGIIGIPKAYNYIKEKKHYEKMYAGKKKNELVCVPDGCGIDENNKPYSIVGRTYRREWGTYTFYKSKSGKCYHSKYGCSHAKEQINAIDTFGMRPCSRCNPKRPSIAWVIKYLCILDIVKKYNIKLKDNY